MSTAIFVVGVVVFLITIYGTVTAGGLLLTGRQLDDQPELDPARPDDSSGGDARRPIIPADY